MNEAGKTPLPPASPHQGEPSRALASLEDVQKLALRTGVIVSAEDHPNADRLLVLNVDLGEPQPRQLVAGIKRSYQASELIGKRVVVVTNLKPAMLRGIESQGMVLAASDETSVILVTPERPIRAGCLVK